MPYLHAHPNYIILYRRKNIKYNLENIFISGGIFMLTAGIITEYNPFHNGHRYQIEQTRSELNCSHINFCYER